jgi:glycosyltransferase involved in cell wall biosynthesis
VPEVAVFTITFNQRHKVLALIGDLTRQTVPPNRFELVVLDDGSSDGTAEAVRKAAITVPYRLTLIAETHEADYLSARRWNQCVAAAAPHSQVFVQVDDVRVRPDFVARHADWHAGPGLRVVTGSKFEGSAETWALESCRRAHLSGSDGTATEGVPWTAAFGASLSYPREIVDKVSTHPLECPFDERMTGWGFHEVEFSYRAGQAGAVLVYDPAVGVFHQDHGPVTDAGRGIDHVEQKARGAAKNEQYLKDKHGLAELPRW